MFLFDLLRRDKLARFAREVREEGIGSAIAKAGDYVGRHLSGRGISGLFQRGSFGIESSENYMASIWQELADGDAFHVTQAPAVLSKRRKIAMIGDLNLPQCRKYRVEQPDEIWRQVDVDYAYSHYEDVPRSVAIMQDATHVMFYRLCTTPVTSMLTYEARRLRLPILYDLDDPLFSVSAYGTYENMKALPAWQRKHFMTEAPKYLDVMNGADVISVSTPGMVAHARLFTPRPVYMRRNFADRVALDAGKVAMQAAVSERPRPQGFRVAFASGSQGHEVDFDVIAKDMTEFLAGGPDRQLVILGHFNKTRLPDALRGQVETHAFADYETYLKTLAGTDVAVMPLTDDAFNRCKSAVRVIDAASVGVPGIVSTVSDMAQVVEDGQTGRVLEAGASWATALEDMVRDREATRAMGKAARADIESRWGASLSPDIIDPEILAWVQA